MDCPNDPQAKPASTPARRVHADADADATRCSTGRGKPPRVPGPRGRGSVDPVALPCVATPGRPPAAVSRVEAAASTQVRVVPVDPRADTEHVGRTSPPRLGGAGIAPASVPRRGGRAAGSRFAWSRALRASLAPVLVALAGCADAPDRLRIEAASVATGPAGGLATAIGIAAGAELVAVLPADCRLPCTSTQVIRPASKQQEVVAFRLYQGNGAGVAGAMPLGTYRLSWAGHAEPPAEIEVTFTADTEGAFVHGTARPGLQPVEITRVAR